MRVKSKGRRAAGWTGTVALLLTSAAYGQGEFAGASSQPASDEVAALRAPAVPLVAHSPNFSIWSPANRLTDETTRHWTMAEQPLVSLIRIDGQAYRLMGMQPHETPALPQTRCTVLPTRTIYTFANPQVKVTMTFMTPSLPAEMDVLARPVTYITWDVQSTDGQPHAVQIYDSMSGLVSVNEPRNEVQTKSQTMPTKASGDLTALRVGAAQQTMLQPAGDGVRTNWGYAYLVAPAKQAQAGIGASKTMTDLFVAGKKLQNLDMLPRAADADEPAVAFTFDLAQVGTKVVSRHLMIGYDEIYSINFLGEKLRPYWRKDGDEPEDLFAKAAADYDELAGKCEAFDTQLMADMATQGGQKYAQLGALAYRQTLAGCGMAADANGMPMFFAKENGSNGCIATVDIIYPAAPQFLMMGSAYAKALVAPSIVYSTSERWKFPFAPHDVGTYPQATGQVYGGGEDSKDWGNMMPVEESANLIILCHAIAKIDGNADFAGTYWKQLTEWEAYLQKYGKDPENQLCTDDFMGHLAHNANLSVKAIVAIAAYGDLCKMRGDAESADKFKQIAIDYAKNWMNVAGDGDHYRIAFDQPNTWSQKYNLVWDKMLDLNVFPKEVAAKETAFYLTQLQPFGLPLDVRTKLSKTDWAVWSATLATDRKDFERIVNPIYDFMNNTTRRLPFADSYETNNLDTTSFRARPVIGGVFIKMLDDPKMWMKYAKAGSSVEGQWADVPIPPKVTVVVATAKTEPAQWQYTTRKPGGRWMMPDFDAGEWKSGKSGFGTGGTPGIARNTEWNTDDIWVRREIKLPAEFNANQLKLQVVPRRGRRDLHRRHVRREPERF